MRKVELRGFTLAVNAFKDKKLILQEDFERQLDIILSEYEDVQLQSWEFGMDGYIVVEFTFNDSTRIYDAVHRLSAALSYIK